MKMKFTIGRENEDLYWSLRRYFKNDNKLGNFLLEHFRHTAADMMNSVGELESEDVSVEEVKEELATFNGEGVSDE